MVWCESQCECFCQSFAVLGPRGLGLSESISSIHCQLKLWPAQWGGHLNSYQCCSWEGECCWSHRQGRRTASPSTQALSYEGGKCCPVFSVELLHGPHGLSCGGNGYLSFVIASIIASQYDFPSTARGNATFFGIIWHKLLLSSLHLLQLFGSILFPGQMASLT